MLSVTLATDPRPAPPPAWGKLASGPSALLAWSHASETSDLAVFSWQERDSLHARYYNPSVARFLSVDPSRDNNLKVPQSWNLYSYVRNNPVNATDPDGRLVQFSDAFIKRLREDRVFRQAFKLWRSTDTGRKQWGKMRDDQNTLYKLNVGLTRNNEGKETSGNTGQTPRPGQKPDKPNDAQEVRMTINADLTERNFLVGRGEAFTSREIADTLGHEAIHGLGLGAGELTYGQVKQQEFRMDILGTDPELDRFKLELQLLVPDSE